MITTIYIFCFVSFSYTCFQQENENNQYNKKAKTKHILLVSNFQRIVVDFEIHIIYLPLPCFLSFFITLYYGIALLFFLVLT